MPQTVTVNLDDLRKRLGEAERKVQELRAVIHFLEGVAPPQEERQPRSESSCESLPDVDEALRDLPAHDAAAVILGESVGPMRTSEIVESLRERGYGRDHRNLQNSVFTALSRRDDMFTKVDRGVWSLKVVDNQELGGEKEGEESVPY